MLSLNLRYLNFCEDYIICFIRFTELCSFCVYCTYAPVFHFFPPYFVIKAILIFSIVDYEVVDYNGYVYPPWAEALGWCFAMVSIVCIPIGAIHALVTSKGTLKEVYNVLPFLLHCHNLAFQMVFSLNQSLHPLFLMSFFHIMYFIESHISDVIFVIIMMIYVIVKRVKRISRSFNGIVMQPAMYVCYIHHHYFRVDISIVQKYAC